MPGVADEDDGTASAAQQRDVPLLSVCLPTYNRAAMIDRQLAWLAAEVAALARADGANGGGVGTDQLIEIVVSDNCSDDATPEIVARWAGAFGSIPFASQRHAANLGWMRNFLSCYEVASGRYCWVVGDDDLMSPGALRVVLDLLTRDDELALVYLNCLARSAVTGGVAMEHWFDPGVAMWDPADGERIFMHCIEWNIGGVITVTAAVCRTDLALEAIRSWPGCLDNWAGMAYWCGYAARRGHVVVTAENHFECSVGDSYWEREPSVLFRVRHRDIPHVYVRLRRIGYPRGFCLKKILGFAKDDVVGPEARTRTRDALRALRQRPGWTLGVLGSYLGAVIRSAVA
jgi:abequosyltransferase